MSDGLEKKTIKDKILKLGKAHWKNFDFIQNPNLKDITKEQFEKLKTSIINDDLIQEFKVWQDGRRIYCLDGFHRCKALRALELEGYKVPQLMSTLFIDCKDKQDAAKKVLKYSAVYAHITDEGLYEFTHEHNIEFDYIKFEMELPGQDLDRYERGYVGTGQPGEENEDDIPDPPAEPVSKLGDLYLLGGRHRLLCGDATKPEDIERLMDGKKADMVFTDPPYGVFYGNKNAYLNAGDNGNRIEENLDNDTLSFVEMKDMWIKSLTNAFDSTKAGGVYYCCSPQGGKLMMMMENSILESGWELKHCLIWVKNNFVLGRADYNYQHEPIFYGWKGGAGHKFYGEGGASSVWNIDKNRVSDLHPTMKPVPLVTRAIKNSSKPKELVLDIFCGSGSTLIACIQNDRTCYMSEIAPNYTDVIIERYKNLTGKGVELISSVNNENY